MMSEKDENLQPSTSQPRREYEPWINHRQYTPLIRSYYESMKELTVGMIIKNIFMFILTVCGLLTLIYYIFKPDLLPNRQMVPELGTYTYGTRTRPVFEHTVESLVPSSPTQSIGFACAQKSRSTDFLLDGEADELCGKHDLLRWTDHSKPRKIYEFIYIDSKRPDIYNELQIHLAENYNDVDYFVLASANDTFRVDIGEYDGNCRSRNLWQFRDKIITHVIRPASKANDPAIPYQAHRAIMEPAGSIECEQKSKQGDTIYIHYTATLEDGTFIGSTHDGQRNGPISYIIGAGSVVGWDKGVQGMCVGENRTIVVPPTLGYGENAAGPIPANSTLIFQTELVAIKEDSTRVAESKWFASKHVESEAPEVKYARPDWYRASVDMRRRPFQELPVTDPLADVHRAYAYNSIYLQALPLLTDEKELSEGDIILISHPDQVPTSDTLSVLRNCQIPPHLYVVSVINGYHHQGEKKWKFSAQKATYYAGEQTVLPEQLLPPFAWDAPAKKNNRIVVEAQYCGECYLPCSVRNGYQGLGRNLNLAMLKRSCCASCEEARPGYESSPFTDGSADEHVEQCIWELKPWDRRIGF